MLAQKGVSIENMKRQLDEVEAQYKEKYEKANQQLQLEVQNLNVKLN